MKLIDPSIPTAARALIAAAALALGAGPALASGTLQVQLSADRTTANTSGEIINYRIDYGYSSATADGENVEIEFDLESDLELVSITGSTHTVSETLGGTKVIFDFVEPLPAGSTGQVKVQARFKSGTADGTVADLLAKISANNASDLDSNAVSVTAVVPAPWTPPTFVEGAYIYKSGPSSIALPGQYGNYYIKHGNTGGPGQDISDYVIEDILPAGTQLYVLGTGRFLDTTNPINVSYITNLDAAWQAWPDNPVTHSASYRYLWPSSLGLASGEWVTGVRLNFGTVPGGGAFHPDKPGNYSVRVSLRPAPGSGFSGGDTIENCASVTGDGGSVSGSSCRTTTLSAPVPNYAFWDWDNTDNGPYQPGDTVRIGVEMGSRDTNGVSVTDLNFSWLMPSQMDYVGNVSHSGNGWNLLGQPAPVFEQIPNFGATGRTLIRFSWPGSVIIPSGNWDTIKTYFDVQVNSSAVMGTSAESEMFGGWQTPQGAGYGWMVEDTLDYDRDGDSSEMVAKDTSTFHFDFPPPDPGSGVASLSSVMWVKGSLDTNWSRFPDTALTTPAGEADYELRITNDGGVALESLTIIDILPHIGDNGVVTSGARGSEWEPFLAAPVATPSGVTVFYSTERNPQRDELTPGQPSGAAPANWTTSPPADITSVKSLKFEWGESWVLPGQEVVISWPMRAPSNAPSSGEVAWNSFGYIATRADDGVELLPVEPVMTGIEVQPAGGAHYGDFVWDDLNRDGFAESGEPGRNGVRVELYKDGGDGVADPAGDTLETFTVTSFDGVTDGSYRFTNLDPGDYYALVEVPSGYNATYAPESAVIPSIGDFETGIGSWWSPASASVMQAAEGGAEGSQWFLEVWSRTVVNDGANLDVTQYVQRNEDYEVEFYTKLFDADEAMEATLILNGIETDSFTSGVVSSGAYPKNPWVKVSGILSTGSVDPITTASLRITTSSSTQEFRIDQVTMRALEMESDSDGIRAVESGRNVAIMPVTTLSAEEQQLYWDQGIFDRASGMAAVWALAEQGDGRIVVGGQFAGAHGVARRNIARLLENGQVDTTFDPGSGADAAVEALTVLGDGTIIAGGEFASYNGTAVSGLVAIAEDGSVAGPISQPDTADVRWLATDFDGKTLIGGGFNMIGGVNRSRLARLNPDGSVDSGFNPVGVNGHVNGGAILDDGRIAIGGEFTQVAGQNRPGVAILNPDGSLDSTFAPTGSVDGPVRSIALKSGQKLILAGDFTTFGGTSVNGTVRVDLTGAVDLDMHNSSLTVESVRQSH